MLDCERTIDPWLYPVPKVYAQRLFVRHNSSLVRSCQYVQQLYVQQLYVQQLYVQQLYVQMMVRFVSRLIAPATEIVSVSGPGGGIANV
jgi:hypothetical protein